MSSRRWVEGSPPLSTLTLVQAATQMRDEDAATAAELCDFNTIIDMFLLIFCPRYLEAIDIFESEEQEQIGADTFRAAIALFGRDGWNQCRVVCLS